MKNNMAKALSPEVSWEFSQGDGRDVAADAISGETGKWRRAASHETGRGGNPCPPRFAGIRSAMLSAAPRITD